MHNCLKTAVPGLLSLLIGAVLYILFRPASYVALLFGNVGWVSQLQDLLRPVGCDFLRFYFPDFLWAFALSCGLQTVFMPQKWGVAACGTAAFACGVIWEGLQKTGAVSGTGDWLDVLMYFLAGVASILINIKETGK